MPCLLRRAARRALGVLVECKKWVGGGNCLMIHKKIPYLSRGEALMLFQQFLLLHPAVQYGCSKVQFLASTTPICLL